MKNRVIFRLNAGEPAPAKLKNGGTLKEDHFKGGDDCLFNLLTQPMDTEIKLYLSY